MALRGQVRVPVTIGDAQFWWEQETGKFGPTSTGALVDISVGGMQVMTKTGLPAETKVLALFTHSPHLFVPATVLRFAPLLGLWRFEERDDIRPAGKECRTTSRQHRKDGDHEHRIHP